MKVVQTVLLAVSLISPAAVGFSAAASEQSDSIYEVQSDLANAVDAFGYSARASLDKLQRLVATKGPSADLSTGIRLSRLIQVGALELADLLDNGASDDELTDKLVSLENYVLQLDATKRRLVARYNDQEVNRTLTYVRTTYFYTKQMLTGGL